MYCDLVFVLFYLQEPESVEAEDPFHCAEAICEAFSDIQEVLHEVLGTRPPPKHDKATITRIPRADACVMAVPQTIEHTAQTDRPTVAPTSQIRHTLAASISPFLDQFASEVREIIQDHVDPHANEVDDTHL